MKIFSIVLTEYDCDNREENKRGESNIAKEFDAITQDIKNNGRTTKSISAESHGSNINLHSLILKLLNAEKRYSKKDYGFDEAFNIFDKIDHRSKKTYEYKPRSSNEINTNNVMLEYMRIMEDKLIDMFFLLLISSKKIKNAN